MDNGKWVKGYYVYNDLECVAVIYVCQYDHTDNGRPYLHQSPVQVHPSTVGQSTGNTVKDFWEDDIVKDGPRKYVITYCVNDAKFYLQGIGRTWCENDPDWRKYSKIGNIHDNPELLEQ